MEQVRADFVSALNVSDLQLIGMSFVERVRELVRLGNGPRVFFSRLSMSSFEDSARKALEEWMHDWVRSLVTFVLAILFMFFSWRETRFRNRDRQGAGCFHLVPV